MAIEELTNLPIDIIFEMGKIALWMQALGIVIILNIISTIVFLIIERKKRKTIKDIQEDVIRIEKKIDRLKK